MLRYRVLLVDTEGSYERPVQAFFNTAGEIDPWAKATLAKATGKNAYVTVYRVNEIEIGTLKKSDYDKGAVSGVQPAGEEAGQSPV